MKSFKKFITESKHPVPGLGRWHTYAGGDYEYYLNDGKENLPASHTTYSIRSVNDAFGKRKHYAVSAWSPKAGHAHLELGKVRDPRHGVEFAREHYDKHFGK